jgi:hypothetical protein
MSGSQAVQMGMNIFNLAQQQAQQQRELQMQQEQQKQENFFTKMQLDMQQERLGLEAQKLKFDKDRLIEEDKRRKAEFDAEQERWQEELGFKKTKLTEEAKPERERMGLKVQGEKPDLAQYPSAIEQAMNLYEQTGNWGTVQAVQKHFGMPVDKTPGKVTEMKEAANVWKFAEKEGLPLTVDRKLGFGGEEMSLPYEVVKRYGADAIEALKKLTSGRLAGVLGTDKYKQYTISQLYEIYFRAKRFRAGGRTKKEIVDEMKKAKIPDDLINDMLGSL